MTKMLSSSLLVKICYTKRIDTVAKVSQSLKRQKKQHNIPRRKLQTAKLYSTAKNCIGKNSQRQKIAIAKIND